MSEVLLRAALEALTEGRPTWLFGTAGLVWANAAAERERPDDPTQLDQLEFLTVPGGRLVRHREDRLARVAARWGLSPAQTRVLAQVVRGLANKEVAADLGIEESTVEAHLGVIFRRSGASNRASLTCAFWTA